MHLGQLLAQLNGLLPHLKRHVHCSFERRQKNKNTGAQASLCHLAPTAVLSETLASLNVASETF